MLQQVLDDAEAKSLPNRGRSQTATTCDSSYAPNSAQHYSLLQSTTPALLLTTKYYSSTTLYCKVLLQYYSVVLCTTMNYSVLCTTKFYSRTTLYYKVLLQYYKVLQSNTHDWYSLHMKRHLQYAEQQMPPSNLTKYCACHAKWLACLVAWSSSHMKRHLQCAGQQVSPSNLTKYCTCHAKWPQKIWQKFAENSWNVIYSARTIPITWLDYSVYPPEIIRRWHMFDSHSQKVCQANKRIWG